MSSDELLETREKRFLRTEAAKFIRSQATSDLSAQTLTWDSLLKLPQWCYWPKPERERLILVAGALFSAPAMRLWIDATRLRTARQLIGDKTFELVMANELVPNEPAKWSHGEDVQALFNNTGAAVLLCSTDKVLRPFVAGLLPDSAGELPVSIAQLLMSQALVTLATIHQINEAAETNEQASSRSE